MISPKHRKQEMTQKHVVTEIERRRVEDRQAASGANAKMVRKLVRRSLFDGIAKKSKGRK